MRLGELLRGGEKIGVSARYTQTAMERMRGLLWRPALVSGEALWITPCNSIHCWFMRYAIDAVYVDGEGWVLKCAANIKPWRMSACWQAAGVIELVAGEVERLGIEVGDQLAFSEAL